MVEFSWSLTCRDTRKFIFQFQDQEEGQVLEKFFHQAKSEFHGWGVTQLAPIPAYYSTQELERQGCPSHLKAWQFIQNPAIYGGLGVIVPDIVALEVNSYFHFVLSCFLRTLHRQN